MRERKLFHARLLGWGAVSVVAILLTSCGGGGGNGGGLGGRSDDRGSESEPASGPCAAAATGSDSGADTDDERTVAKRILECVSPSVVFVDTPIGTGSGVLLEDGYVVTNAHVVDPYPVVNVTIEGEDTVFDVPVVGVDLLADIAVVGPVETESAAVEFGDMSSVEKGDTVFLVGYPGEVDTEPEATISQGIVSRIREAKPYDQTYVQTDAAIGGGQSGGALVDGEGRVLGISGLSFAEEFALALSAEDVQDAVRSIRDGDGDSYHPLPDEGGVEDGTITLASSDEMKLLFLPYAAEERTLTFTLPADQVPSFEVDSLLGDVLYVNQEAIDQAAEWFDIPADQLGLEADVPATPGVFEVEVPEETEAIIMVGTLRGEGATMAFTSTEEVIPYDDDDDGATIAAGDRVEGAIDALEFFDTYTIDLEAGDVIDIFVGCPTGDMAFSVLAPGQLRVDAVYVDDSGEGLYDTDAHDEFEAEVAGTYTIEVTSNIPIASGYIIEVNRAGDADASDDSDATDESS